MTHLPLQRIPLDTIIKRTTYQKKYDYIVDLMRDGEHFFFPGFDTVRFQDGIDWEYQHPHSANTYSLYLHSLDVVSYLCNFYEKHGDEDILHQAKDILFTWMHHDNDVGMKTRFAWSDHTVANRMLTTIYYFLLDETLTDDEEALIRTYLITYAVFLYDDEHYVENNHGIMMDRALILATVILEEHELAPIWRDKAIIRIKAAFARDFSSKHVHLENSPDYHSMVIRLFKTTETFLNAFELSLGKDLQMRINLADEYFSYVVKPDRRLPMIGDTAQSKQIATKKIFTPFIDAEAGIAILQSKHATDPAQSTWLSFVCGYGSRTHKHHDDLSINLSFRGHDVLIDSGKYNYNKKDPIRDYIISPEAHSTVVVEGERYPIVAVDRARKTIQMSGFITSNRYQLVQGINNAYPGTTIKRTILYFLDDLVIVVDQITSKQLNTYRQQFNLSPHVSLSHTEDNEMSADVGGERVTFTQHMGVSPTVVYEGNKEIPVAVISEEFGNVIETNQCAFTKTGEQAIFVTSIALGNQNNRLKSLYYDEEMGVLRVKIDYDHFSIGI